MYEYNRPAVWTGESPGTIPFPTIHPMVMYVWPSHLQSPPWSRDPFPAPERFFLSVLL